MSLYIIIDTDGRVQAVYDNTPVGSRVHDTYQSSSYVKHYTKLYHRVDLCQEAQRLVKHAQCRRRGNNQLCRSVQLPIINWSRSVEVKSASC